MVEHDDTWSKRFEEKEIMTDDEIHRIPINQLRQEDGVHELATSPDMEPYSDFAMAVMRDADPTPELEAIRLLPLGKSGFPGC